jgi:hypothetical protein
MYKIKLKLIIQLNIYILIYHIEYVVKLHELKLKYIYELNIKK